MSAQPPCDHPALIRYGGPRATALKTSFTLALWTIFIASGAAVTWAQPASKDKEMSEAFLVPASDLKRHKLPAMQRSFINLAFRQDALIYMDDGNDTDPRFFGFGGPMLSYKRARWRSFTVWLNSDIGFQFESALSVVLYKSERSKEEWYLPSEYLLGFHAGIQDLKRYDSYDSYTLDSGGVYRSPETLFYGLQLALHYPDWWIELSWDFSELFSEEESYGNVYGYTSGYQLSLTRIGLSVGAALF